VTHAQPRDVRPPLEAQGPPDSVGGPSFAPAPEQALLRACALADPLRSAAAVAEVAPRVADWAALRASAVHHGLVVTLFRRLSSGPAAAAPPDELDRLHALAVANERRSLVMGGQLLRLIGLLAAAGVEALPYKGPVMAEILYGDAGVRQSVDLDLLVRPRDVEVAMRSLAAAGFRQASCLGVDRERLLASESEVAFESPDETFLIDLHWRLGPRFAHASLGADDLFAHARPSTFLGKELRVLSRVDLFVVLCVHGAHSHRWDELELVAALGAWGADASPDEWRVLFERAAALGCLRRCLIGCRLMRDLTGCAVPATIGALLDSDPLAVALARLARLRLCDDGVPARVLDGLRGVLWESLALDSRGAAALHFGARVVTPGTWDWESNLVSPRLPALYYLSRPIRLARRYLGRGGAD